LKLKDQQTAQIEVYENEDISEIVKSAMITHKLPKEIKDSLHIHIIRKLEGIIPW